MTRIRNEMKRCRQRPKRIWFNIIQKNIEYKVTIKQLLCLPLNKKKDRSY